MKSKPKPPLKKPESPDGLPNDNELPARIGKSLDVTIIDDAGTIEIVYAHWRASPLDCKKSIAGLTVFWAIMAGTLIFLPAILVLLIEGSLNKVAPMLVVFSIIMVCASLFLLTAIVRTRYGQHIIHLQNNGNLRITVKYVFRDFEQSISVNELERFDFGFRSLGRHRLNKKQLKHRPVSLQFIARQDGQDHPMGILPNQKERHGLFEMLDETDRVQLLEILNRWLKDKKFELGSEFKTHKKPIKTN